IGTLLALSRKGRQALRLGTGRTALTTILAGGLSVQHATRRGPSLVSAARRLPLSQQEPRRRTDGPVHQRPHPEPFASAPPSVPGLGPQNAPSRWPTRDGKPGQTPGRGRGAVPVPARVPARALPPGRSAGGRRAVSRCL